MDKLSITQLRIFLLLAVLTPVKGQVCYTTSVATSDSSTRPDELVTLFVPGAAGEERVQLVSVRADSTPISIQLLPSASTDAVGDGFDYYEIILGTDGTGSYPYTVAGDAVTIARLSGDTAVEAPTDATIPISRNIISMNAGSYEDYFIKIVQNNDGSETIEVGFASDSSPFESLTDPNPLDVSFIGVTGAGDYRVCESTAIQIGLQSAHSTFGSSESVLIDGNKGSCVSSGGGPPLGYRISMDGEYEVWGVTTTGSGTLPQNLEGVTIQVGNCGYQDLTASISSSDLPEINKNVDCGNAITGEESDDADDIVFRKCPENTYGSMIYLLIDETASFGPICELTVYGRKRPDDEKTTVSFQSATETVTEDDTGSTAKTITLTRSGHSSSNPTCTYAFVYNIGPTSGNLLFDGDNDDTCANSVLGDDDDILEKLVTGEPVQVIFDVDDDSKDFDLTICGDKISEGDEFATLGFDESVSRAACAGNTPTTRLTIEDNDPEYYFDPPTYKVGEGDGTVTLTIKRSGYTGEATTITLKSIPNGDATTGDDFMEVDEEITFQEGDLEETYTVTIIDDDDGEGEHMFTVQIQDDLGVQHVIGDNAPPNAESEATITIEDNEPAFTLGSATFQGTETDGYIEVTVENGGSTVNGGKVTLTVSESTVVSAEQGSDFEPFTITETFATGELFKTVQIPITDDISVEGAETFEVTLTSGEDPPESSHILGVAMATLTIEDDDATVSMAVSSQGITERNDSVVVVINRESDEYIDRMAWVDVEIVADTATAPEDYTVPDTLRAYFISGQDSTSITIPVVNDREIEDDQTFTVRIVGADSPIDDTADTTTVTIKSDDASIYLEQKPNQVLEGETFVATVILEGGDGFDHEVYFNTNSDAGNAATAGIDFEVISTTLTFAVDEHSKTVMIDTYEDDDLEDTESFRVSITDPIDVITISELDVDILDDDSLVGFEQTLYEVTETTGSDTFVEVTLTRGGDISNPLSVVLSTVESNGAKAGDDFGVINSMTLTFEAERDSIPLQITIEADDTPEFVETFQIIVTDTDGGMENIDPARSVADITITDDDSGSFRFDETEYIVQEGQGFLSASILRPGATAGFVDLLVTTSPISATYGEDYLQEEVRVQFSPGQDRDTIQIAIVGDNDFQEGDETFLITLSVESNFGTVDPDYNEATVTIQDSQSTFSLSTTTPTVLESVPGYVEITITRSGSTNTDALVSLQTRDGTATHSGDFKGFSIKTFAFPSGTTQMSFKIEIDNNDIREDSEETFSVVIVSADGVIEDDGTLTITIIDDDGYFALAPTYTSDDDPSDNVVYYTTTEDEGLVTITVQRTGNVQGYASVRATTVEDTADSDDYIPFDTRVINFVPTQSTSEFTVTIENDEEREGDESFYVELSLPSNGVLIEPRKAKITIESNDRPAGGRPKPLSTNSVIGIAVGVGGIVIIAAIAGVALFLLSRPAPVPVKPQLPGPRPVRPAGFRPTPGVAPNPYRSQLYPQFRGY